MKRLFPLLLALALLTGCGGTAPRVTALAEAPSVPPAESAAPTAVPTPEPTPAPTPELQYELWEGQVPHIFIHSLIAYPEKKKSGGLMEYDGECIDVTEFKNMLGELYANGYSLVDVYDCFGTDADGKLRFRDAVEVPAGRKPVILSIDDVVYDYKKRGHGMVDLLALDGDGELVSGTYLPDGTIDYSYDREAFPILEAFVREHPAFSSHGARMTLCMTGFAGVFGYRTEVGDFTGDRDAEIAKAAAVADRLRELGYSFASHSYGHYNHEKHTTASLTRDLQSFQDQVTPILGPASVYVYPYGKLVPPGDPKYALMQSYGFQVFCSVSDFFYSRNYDDGKSLYMTRVAVDGFSLRNYRAVLAPLFDTEKVIDRPNRP